SLAEAANTLSAERDTLKEQLNAYTTDENIQEYVNKKSSAGLLSTQTFLNTINLTDDNDDMETEEIVTLGSSAINKNSSGLSKPVVKRNDILKNTRALRTAAKNLVDKLARLRLWLVKYNDAKSTQQRKKYYQFRFTSPDNSEIKMYDENRKAADEKVAL